MYYIILFLEQHESALETVLKQLVLAYSMASDAERRQTQQFSIAGNDNNTDVNGNNNADNGNGGTFNVDLSNFIADLTQITV